ncbi:hypothetical protein Bbelb_393790 [Branchiostoma belcheri]|nr:hypothetical protein Bbelb_393790 [Branchiostoma belcheri]
MPDMHNDETPTATTRCLPMRLCDQKRSSQKHEMCGTTKLYQQFDELGVQIADHAHDRNHTINKFIKDRPPLPMEPGPPTPMISGMNQHDNCNAASRCRTDPNYRPRKLILQDQRAVEMLRSFIQKQDVYRHPSGYVTNMWTALPHQDTTGSTLPTQGRIMGGKRVLSAKTNNFLRDLLLTFLQRVRTAGGLPDLPQGRRRNADLQADGDRLSDYSDYSSSDEEE